MQWPGWITDNVLVSIAAGAFTLASKMVADRVRLVMAKNAKDDSLLRGYDNFANRLNARVDVLEKELDRREVEHRRLIFEADSDRRKCETQCAHLRLRVEDLERRLGRPDLRPESDDRVPD